MVKSDQISITFGQKVRLMILYQNLSKNVILRHAACGIMRNFFSISIHKLGSERATVPKENAVQFLFRFDRLDKFSDFPLNPGVSLFHFISSYGRVGFCQGSPIRYVLYTAHPRTMGLDTPTKTKSQIGHGINVVHCSNSPQFRFLHYYSN